MTILRTVRRPIPDKIEFLFSFLEDAFGEKNLNVENMHCFPWDNQIVLYKDKNALILQDADNLDAIGAIGIGRSLLLIINLFMMKKYH